MRKLLCGAALLAGAAVGWACGYGCDDMDDCPDRLEIELVGPDGNLEPGPLAVLLEIDGTTIRCEVDVPDGSEDPAPWTRERDDDSQYMGSGARADGTCDDERIWFAASRVCENDACFAGRYNGIAGLTILGGRPSPVQVRVERSGTVVAQKRLTPRYDYRQDERCGGCQHGHQVVTLGG